MLVQDEKFYWWDQKGQEKKEVFLFFFCTIKVGKHKNKSKKQALSALGVEEGNGGFNCNISFG